jgi:hypothetical protein
MAKAEVRATAADALRLRKTTETLRRAARRSDGVMMTDV